MKGRFTKGFVERVELASLEWKAGPSREKFRAVIYGLAAAQKDSNDKGLKKLYGRAVISVSARDVSTWYHDSVSRMKFRKVLLKYCLIQKDGSWMSAVLCDQYEGRHPYCNKWHITEPDFNGPKVEVEFSDNYGLFSIYKKDIEKAEGKAADKAHFFHGKWAIQSYKQGKLRWSDFIEVGKAAHNLLKGSYKKGVSCRVFDAVSLCKKDLRGKVFQDKQGRKMEEIWDVAGAINITAPLGMAVLGMKNAMQNKDFIKWATDLSLNASKDPYEKIFNAIYEVDRNTNAYGTKRDFKKVRKTLKMDVQCVANCDPEYLKECKKAYKDFFSDVHVKQNRRRQALVGAAIRRCNKYLADAINRTKASELTDAFYRIHTLGEKVMMNALIDEFNKCGFTVHRVHDALWTSDERLTSLDKRQMNKLIGKIFLKMFPIDQDPGYGRSGIERMVSKAGVTQEEIDWAREGVAVK